jgi:threonine dehydratase
LHAARKTVVVISGGNIEPALLARVLSESSPGQ